jgi:long-subunit acyl-CoA synthetase (AMP-forming)
MLEVGGDIDFAHTKPCYLFVTAETSPTSHYCPYEAPRAGSCGKLLPTVAARVVDPVGRNLDFWSCSANALSRRLTRLANLLLGHNEGRHAR